MMAHQGYYRFPTLWNNTIVFTCEDDLWTVPVTGGVARRLTSNVGECTRSVLSPDGSMLAFTGKEEGNPEVYIMPAEGGKAKRLTYQGAALGTHVIGWTPDSSSVLFTSNAGQPFLKLYKLFSINVNGGLAVELPYGAAMSVSYGPGKRAVIARNMLDIARWKRYRGGTAGVLWVDAKGDGNFKPLLSLKGNFSSPMWIGNRIYFIGDHEGIGNIYSCKPDGTDVRRHTEHEEYYARNAYSDGKNIVYHSGGDIYFLDVAANKASKVNIEFLSPAVQQNRKFVDAAKYLQDYAVHPEGHSLAVTVRGKSFTMPFWEEAPMQQGVRDGVRYRLTQWLNDGKRVVTVSDEGGEEAIEVHYADNSKPKVRFDSLNIGRPLDMVVSPVK
ncbi:MAG TPA: peptidase, partial [Candidatus Kapabacteria bacterium]|nr:peptidase [Candidatus Kapabacteria bacterium]